MSSKVLEYIDTRRPATPCLVVDLDEVVENYRRIQDRLPLAHIYYAVKANPAAPILNRLVGLGSYFDAASVPEIDMCLAENAKPASISFGNVVKKEADIAAAFGRGVRLFAFDSDGELDKLARAAPGAKVYARIAVSNGGADWPLSRKFGCTPEMARDLLVRARELGLDAYGVSFHVGSQQTDPGQWDAAIARAAMVFTDLKASGIDLRMINLGGGFPVPYHEDVPGFGTFADAIMKAMTREFGNNLPEILIEPGRSICATAGVLSTEVVLVARKSYEAPERWVYLDIGKFGGLAETMDEAIRYSFRTPHDGGPDGPVAIAGPTCDGADILYEKTPYRMPMALTAGDKVRIVNAGAYTTTYASVAFNGFAPLDEYYI